MQIENPKRRIVEDLKIRNKDNMRGIAGEYFGSKFTYAQTFKMFEDYKKAFIAIDGLNEDTITISAPSTIASVNAFYGALDANKVINMTGPGFLHAYTEQYTKRLNSKTVVMFDSFLNDDLVAKFQAAGVKNLIVTSVTDYMNPIVKFIATKRGLISGKDYLDEYAKSHNGLPQGMEMMRLKEFAKLGSKIKETYDFPYEENKLAAYFLTGATTSQFPKCVKISADGFTKMARIYDELWFDFKPGDRQTVFIPLFYATGAVHGVHAGLMDGMTLIYKPKYDRFAFAKDLLETKAKIALVAPSHVATLEESRLEDNALNHLKYIFIGGEAIMPAAMEKFRKTGDRLGIQYILNGYGMTETGSMSGISDKESKGEDVTVTPVPGVEYRIVDPVTREILPDNARGILEKKSPCATLGYFEEEKIKLHEKISALEAKLQEALAMKERALSMAQQTRIGYVYVISNVRSFGENVYKIGMTRRLEPMDRVRELSDASVPFAFDVHHMIYTDDAPKLEAQLHQKFSEARLNTDNYRKEFFRVPLTEITNTLKEIGVISNL